MPARPVSSRRGFLGGLAIGLPAAIAALRGGAAYASVAQEILPVREISLQHRHTGERLRLAYFADGQYLDEAIATISRFLRDWRTDEVIPFDPKVLDIAFMIQQQIGPTHPIEILCGYRSPETNAKLRRQIRGVARNSLHMYGMAIDLRFPSHPLAAVHRAANELHAGGVGFYPASDFIHIDSGPVRHWTQRGRVSAGRDGGVPRSVRGRSSSKVGKLTRRTRARLARLSKLGSRYVKKTKR